MPWLKRKKGDLISDRFRDSVIEWKEEKAAQQVNPERRSEDPVDIVFAAPRIVVKKTEMPTFNLERPSSLRAE